jgi:hypothetical protein
VNAPPCYFIRTLPVSLLTVIIVPCCILLFSLIVLLFKLGSNGLFSTKIKYCLFSTSALVFKSAYMVRHNEISVFLSEVCSQFLCLCTLPQRAESKQHPFLMNNRLTSAGGKPRLFNKRLRVSTSFCIKVNTFSLP